MAETSDQTVIIDEIQKLPVLLDEVQLLIDRYGIRFVLTGSSARKLTRVGTNLLGGRVRGLVFSSRPYSAWADQRLTFLPLYDAFSATGCGSI